MTRSAIHRSLKILIPERLSAVAVQAGSHVKALSPVNVRPVADAVAICTGHTGAMVDTVVEHHMFGQRGLLRPGMFRSLCQGRIKRLDTGALGKRQPVAVHTLRLGGQISLGSGISARMAGAAREPDGIPVHRVHKRYGGTVTATRRFRDAVHQQIRKEKGAQQRNEGNKGPLHGAIPISASPDRPGS